MRICKAKADLKKITQVEVSTRNMDRKNCTVLDGVRNSLVYCMANIKSHYKQPLVKDYVESFKQYCNGISAGVMSILYLIGILSLAPNVQHASPDRGPGGCKVFQLSANSPLPPQKQVLAVSENKKKLIQIIVETLIVEAVVSGWRWGGH